MIINSQYSAGVREALRDGAKRYEFYQESPEEDLPKGSIVRATVYIIEIS